MPRLAAVSTASRAVGVLHDHVGALIDQRLGGVGFLARIEPLADPDDLDLDVRIDGLRADHRRVDAGDHFRDRHRADVAHDARLRHLGRDHALDVAALVEAARIGREVFLALVSGGVLEHEIGIFLRHLHGRVHEPERGGEDQLVARARQLLDRALGVRPFWHLLQIGRLDLVAERLDHGQAALIVLIAPAEVADRADIDESDLQLVLGRRRRSKRQQGGGGNQEFPHGLLSQSDGPSCRKDAPPSRALFAFSTVRHEGETQ